MSNETNRPEKSYDELNAFERILRDQSLGSGHRDRGDLMYRCGYAAGVAANHTRQQRATVRWRRIGLAASILACVSFSTHFFPTGVNDSGPLGIEMLSDSDPPQNNGTSVGSNSSQWIMQLTHDGRSGEQYIGVLRASGPALIDTAGEGSDIAPQPFEFDSQGKTLTPGDLPLFL